MVCGLTFVSHMPFIYVKKDILFFASSNDIIKRFVSKSTDINATKIHLWR